MLHLNPIFESSSYDNEIAMDEVDNHRNGNDDNVDIDLNW